jgi:hypothetical protein
MLVARYGALARRWTETVWEMVTLPVEARRGGRRSGSV